MVWAMAAIMTPTRTTTNASTQRSFPWINTWFINAVHLARLRRRAAPGERWGMAVSGRRRVSPASAAAPAGRSSLPGRLRRRSRSRRLHPAENVELGPRSEERRAGHENIQRPYKMQEKQREREKNK